MKKRASLKQDPSHSGRLEIYEAPLERALKTFEILEKTYPDAHCALHYKNPYELLMATILSAQCTDVRVNQVTKDLFLAYSDVNSLAGADISTLENQIRSTGFFRNKARSLIGCAEIISTRYEGKVPETMEELIQLPGVGRKTANVLLGNAFAIQAGVVVDTHVKRISYRLGWTENTDPEKIEQDLCRILPRKKWTQASHILIFHGRRLCKAPIPICSDCPVKNFCPANGVKRAK